MHGMELAEFIRTHMEEILRDWEAFAETMTPAANTMNSRALRDHAKAILQAIAEDLTSEQTDKEQTEKSKGWAPVAAGTTAAAIHGSLRQTVGFDLTQLAAEYRALRASVLRLWEPETKSLSLKVVLRDVGRFNEAVDQALAESIVRYSEEVTQSRDTFLAVLGHDLRNPLNSISMSVYYLGRPGAVPDAQRLKAVARINNGVATMGVMIRDLLEYSRTQLGKGIPVTVKACDLADICKAAIDEAQSANPTAQVVFDSSGDLAGAYDAPRLHQVFSNLLVNAIQHGTDGVPVNLSASAEPAHVTVRVKNYGPVIPEDMRQVIFNPLVQLPQDESPHAKYQTNLGLGLYIAREIVLGHGGKIEVASSEAEGTVFTVELPVLPKRQSVVAGS